MLLALGGCGRMPAPAAPQAALPASASPDDAAPALAGAAPASSDAPAEVALAGDAADPALPAQAATPVPDLPDPLQRVNRGLYRVDMAVNRLAAGAPMVGDVARRTPKPVRQGLTNAFANLDEPTAAANQLLQRKPGRALKTAVRFVINSTAGLAGLFDVAGRLGLKRAHADFGQTLASYGVGPGAYLYLPLKGPTNVRDVAGGFADAYFWPFHWFRLSQAESGAMTAAKLDLKLAANGAKGGAAPLAPSRDAYLDRRRAAYGERLAQISGSVPPLAGGPPVVQEAANGRSRARPDPFGRLLQLISLRSAPEPGR